VILAARFENALMFKINDIEI